MMNDPVKRLLNLAGKMAQVGKHLPTNVRPCIQANPSTAKRKELLNLISSVWLMIFGFWFVMSWLSWSSFDNKVILASDNEFENINSSSNLWGNL
jgi:hypothetical protein